MNLYKIILSLSFVMLFSGAGFADECIGYKLTPSVYLDVPVWEKEVVQPLVHMDLLHGNVIATLTDNYDIIADITSLEDGTCVALKSVEATVGYSNFLVQIDLRHLPNTCSYDAILLHEDEHIRTYLSIMDDNKSDFMTALYGAANSVMPVFIPLGQDVNQAINILNEELQAHPDLILVKQKLKAEEEIRNLKVDKNNTGDALKKCFE